MTENVYDKAREVLRERGWARNPHSGDEGVCILGACAVAMGLSGLEWAYVPDQTRDRLAGVIREQFPDRRLARHDFMVPWDFNDSDGTTEHEVDLVLHKAALILDEQVQA